MVFKNTGGVARSDEKSKITEMKSVTLLALLGEQHGVNVGQHTTVRDGDSAKELVELLVIADGKCQVTGCDPGLLVVASSVSSELEHLSAHVLHDSSQVHRSSASNPLAVATQLEVTVDTSHRELQSSLSCAGGRFLL